MIPILILLLVVGYFLSSIGDKNIFITSPQFHFLIFGTAILVPSIADSSDVYHQAYIIIACAFFYVFIALGRKLKHKKNSSFTSPIRFSKAKLWLILLMTVSVAVGQGISLLYGIATGDVSILSIVAESKSNIAGGAIVNSMILSLFYVCIAVLIKEGVNYKQLLILCLLSAVIAASTLQLGRFTFLKMVATPLVFFILFNNEIRLSFKKFTPIFIALLAVIAVPAFYVLNLLRHGYFDKIESIDASQLFSEGLVSARTDTNPGANLLKLMSWSDTHGFDFGAYHIRFLLNFIPRFFWEDKPIISSQFGRTIELFGIDPIFDGTTMTFTFLDSYASFGPFALLEVALIGLVLGKVSKSVFTSETYLQAFLIVILMNSINYFRTNYLDSLVFLIVGFVFFKFSYAVIKKTCSYKPF